MNIKQYGCQPSKEDVKQYELSPNWNGGRFQNLEETKMGLDPLKIPELIYTQLTTRSTRTPDSPLPVLPLDQEQFLTESSEAKFAWYGHSAILMRLAGKTLLIDPMFGPDASPIGPIRTKRFSVNTLDLIESFPEIDLLLLSHDHYDHLDLASIERLLPKTRQFLVALGVKRHLVKWGIDPDVITEFDWWDYHSYDGIDITFTPTRHFSGRGLKDRAKSLWGGWAFKTMEENIWFSGDSGYGKHFKEVGERLGPFDFAFMECGQYNENWAQIHMFPEESVQAAIDARAFKAMPVHWGAFTLAPHHWTDPVQRFVVAAIKHGQHFTLPRLGEVFTAERSKAARWWNEVLVAGE